MQEELKKELQKMDDEDLFYFLRDVLNDRVMGWAESTTSYNEPTTNAKLAVIKHILCAV
jgi:hypothetical protein